MPKGDGVPGGDGGDGVPKRDGVPKGDGKGGRVPVSVREESSCEGISRRERYPPEGQTSGGVGKQIPETEIRDFYCKDTIFLRYRKGLSGISSVLPFFRPLEPPLISL